MDGDLGSRDAQPRAPAAPRPANAAPSAPERLAALYRRIVPARRAEIALPDLAGCYDYDL